MIRLPNTYTVDGVVHDLTGATISRWKESLPPIAVVRLASGAEILLPEYAVRTDEYIWFSYDPDGDGFQLHREPELARNEAEGALDAARDEAADGGWPEGTDSICWGRVYGGVHLASSITLEDATKSDPELAKQMLANKWDAFEVRELVDVRDPGAAETPIEAAVRVTLDRCQIPAKTEDGAVVTDTDRLFELTERYRDTLALALLAGERVAADTTPFPERGGEKLPLVMEWISRAFTLQFDSVPEAKNYLEWGWTVAGNPPRRFSVQIQREDGKSPGELAAEAREEAAQLREILHRVSEALDGGSAPVEQLPELVFRLGQLWAEAKQEQERLRAIVDAPALRAVLDERVKQIAERGDDAQHDDEHNWGELAEAAAHIASVGGSVHAPPWADQIVDKHSKDRRKQLVIATSLLLAEIERLDRASGAQ